MGSSAEDELAAATETDKKIVLVIDDDPNVVYLLRENLTEAGYRVVGATSAEEGRQKAREFRPFAITLDILMPLQDGWQMLHELKTDMTTSDIPIIVLSVVDNKELAHRLGAFDCLLKPIDRDLMLTTLARITPALRRPAEQGQTNEKNSDRGGRGVQPRSSRATFGGRLRNPDGG
jgi:DNA-binding response OmpR family regulator